MPASAWVEDQLRPFKAIISRWISPDLMKGEPISVSKAKKAIADYKKANGRPAGMAELSIFYCEEAFGFLEILQHGTTKNTLRL